MKTGEVERLCIINMAIALVIGLSAALGDYIALFLGLQQSAGIGWKQAGGFVLSAIVFFVNGYYWRYYKI